MFFRKLELTEVSQNFAGRGKEGRKMGKVKSGSIGALNRVHIITVTMLMGMRTMLTTNSVQL